MFRIDMYLVCVYSSTFVKKTIKREFPHLVNNPNPDGYKKCVAVWLESSMTPRRPVGSREDSL
jgi:hypothetical protein